MRDIPRVQWMVDDVRELMHWIPFEDNGDDIACDEGPMGKDIILQAATLIGLR